MTLGSKHNTLRENPNEGNIGRDPLTYNQYLCHYLFIYLIYFVQFPMLGKFVYQDKGINNKTL